MVSYLIHYDTLLQNATDIITKCDRSLLQNATDITNCNGTGSFIKVIENMYYTLRTTARELS